MKIEQKVVSLELAKELKKAGYKQEGLFYWCGDEDIIVVEYDLNNNAKEMVSNFICFAPTVAELGEALPIITDSRKIQDGRKIIFITRYSIRKPAGLDWESVHFRANTEVDARAKMWLYLKKEKLI